MNYAALHASENASLSFEHKLDKIETTGSEEGELRTLQLSTSFRLCLSSKLIKMAGKYCGNIALNSNIFFCSIFE